MRWLARKGRAGTLTSAKQTARALRFAGCYLGAIALIASAPAPAQPAGAFPLETLRVQGNRRIPAEKIIAIVGLKIGTPVAKADFDAARGRLLETGAFESVGYEFKPSAASTGYDSVFEVVEIDRLFPYRFDELPISEDAMRAELRKREPLFGDQIPATPAVLDRYARAIESFVGRGTKVVGKLNSDVPGHLAIVFRPPTPRAAVADVRFKGNDVLPAALLVSTLSQVAIGVPYSEATMRLLLDSSIRPLYEARGRIRVAFPEIAAEKSQSIDVDGVIVTVTVSEGPSYSLGAVRFAGVASADLEEAQKTANFQTKDIVNFDDINAGMDRVYSRYKSKGYLRVTSHIDRDIHDAEHTVDLTVNLDTGPRFKMGKLEIKGLDIISEPAIRKSWTLMPGAPFEAGYPDSFLNDLRDEGVFENLGKTTADARIDDKTNTVDVTLHFSGSAEKPVAKQVF